MNKIWIFRNCLFDRPAWPTVIDGGSKVIPAPLCLLQLHPLIQIWHLLAPTTQRWRRPVSQQPFTKPTRDLPLFFCNLGYINESIHLTMNQIKETPQHPSLEVYFWYHHQNFYKTFSDNNILKEEPCFCAWTRSPQKCFRSEYSKKNQKSKQVKEKKKNQQQTSYQRKQCSAYLQPTEMEFSL